jgi:hypothetical protein
LTFTSRPAFEVFVSLRLVCQFDLAALSSSSLSFPSRVFRPFRPLSLSSQLPPLRSLPLRRFPDRGQPLSPGGTTPRYVALSAFRTLSGLFSDRCLPALFHAGPVLGVSSFRAVFRPQSIQPLDLLALLRLAARFPAASIFLRRRRRDPACAAKKIFHDTALLQSSPTSGLCSLRSSVSQNRLLHPVLGPRPSWTSPSSGVFRLGLALSGATLSCA